MLSLRTRSTSRPSQTVICDGDSGYGPNVEMGSWAVAEHCCRLQFPATQWLQVSSHWGVAFLIALHFGDKLTLDDRFGRAGS